MWITKKAREKLKAKPERDDELGFGKFFTDYMFSMKWDEARGWHDAAIIPYGPIALDPAATVFHYGQEIFEGMKAYWRGPFRFALFRPKENAKRFNRSARRMVMPIINEDMFEYAIIELVKRDFDWIPKTRGCSLYIRPTMIATEAALGLHASREYLFYIILSPVGTYFQGGFSPTSIYVSDRDARAADGGVGAAKTGGNYAASMLTTEEAKKKGYSQVLWLDATRHEYAEEGGAMNIFFVRRRKRGYTVETPRLDGTIMAGITRDSIIKLAAGLGFRARDKRLGITRLIEGIKRGEITEVFCAGTAAIITPIGKLFCRGEEIIINGNEAGPVTRALYDELTGIQYGEKEDSFGWVKEIKF